MSATAARSWREGEGPRQIKNSMPCHFESEHFLMKRLGDGGGGGGVP